MQIAYCNKERGKAGLKHMGFAGKEGPKDFIPDVARRGRSVRLKERSAYRSAEEIDNVLLPFSPHLYPTPDM